MSDEELAALDAARGHEPRASFIRRAVAGAAARPAWIPGVLSVSSAGASGTLKIDRGS